MVSFTTFLQLDDKELKKPFEKEVRDKLFKIFNDILYRVRLQKENNRKKIRLEAAQRISHSVNNFKTKIELGTKFAAQLRNNKQEHIEEAVKDFQDNFAVEDAALRREFQSNLRQKLEAIIDNIIKTRQHNEKVILVAFLAVGFVGSATSFAEISPILAAADEGLSWDQIPVVVVTELIGLISGLGGEGSAAVYS